MNLLVKGGRIKGGSKCTDHELAPGCLKEEKNSSWLGMFYTIFYFFLIGREETWD